jgi:uncharacterized SAM-binding protein YcdF (DUF218 family)
MELRYLIKGMLLPPAAQIIILVLAFFLRNRMPRLAKAGFLIAVLSLWALATPAVSNFLAHSLEQEHALLPSQLKTVKADAIVILAGRQNERSPEFGEPVSVGQQLSRLRYGVFLYRNTGIPILLSGGSVLGNEERSLAETMASELEYSFDVKATWLEKKSRTTAENAKYSYSILEPLNKKSIILVTSSLHMLRARWSFEQAGFNVLPAPTGFIDRGQLKIYSFLPSSHNLNLSSEVIHEWLGYWAYGIIEY